ncbi:MAG TPA: response regulator [Candidatus Avalokitesvara rifleensis]|uniref:response regulator n=1 Tax=Candidatus Avalokitesvara rifleensis TaxID=3367620 RepID=UPI002713355C|nr:response regulator [Candidatus Brocadiales bacterium]
MSKPEKTPLSNKHTILVVDDDPEIVTLLSKILLNEGHNVMDAQNGRKALRKVEKGGIDLVILDLIMPEMGGIEVLKRLGDMAPKSAVIVLTGHGDLQTAREAMMLGAYEYITKPFDADFVKAVVRRALRNGPASAVSAPG